SRWTVIVWPSEMDFTSRGSVRTIPTAISRTAISFCIRTSDWRGLAPIVDRALQGCVQLREVAELSRELVAETVDGDDEFRGFGVGFDLLPQPGDVDVDRPRQRRLVVAPDVREQRIARQCGAAMHDEMSQQLELARGQIDSPSVAPDLHRT